MRLHEEVRRSDLFILSEKVFDDIAIGLGTLIQKIAASKKRPRKDVMGLITFNYAPTNAQSLFLHP